MIRAFRLILAVACLVAGLVIGVLNPQPAVLDLGFAHASSSLGVVVLLALLAGFVAGGLALAASVVMPMRQRLRRAESAALPPKNPEGP